MDGGRKEAAATEVWLHFAIMFHQKQFEDYHIVSVIRLSIFSKKFCLINLDLFQNQGASYCQVFCMKWNARISLCWEKGDMTVIRNFENAVVLQWRWRKKHKVVVASYNQVFIWNFQFVNLTGSSSKIQGTSYNRARLITQKIHYNIYNVIQVNPGHSLT